MDSRPGFPTTRVWMRTQPRARIYAAVAFVLGLGLCAVPLVPARHSPTSYPFWTSFVLFLSTDGIGIAILVAGVRIARAGLWVDDNRLVVRGVLRTRTFALGDVDSVEPRPVDGSNRMTPCPEVRRKHGRPFPVFALAHDGFLQGGAAGRRRQAQKVKADCDALNALLAGLRNGQPR